MTSPPYDTDAVDLNAPIKNESLQSIAEMLDRKLRADLAEMYREQEAS